MKKQLFPREFINSSLEHYTFQIGKKSNAIYLVLIVFFLLVLTSLPFLKTNVTTTASGNIDTKTQRFELRAPVSGRITETNLGENILVRKEDLLVQFDHSIIDMELAQINSRLADLDRFKNDLTKLVRHPAAINQDDFRSSRYQIAFLNFRSGLEKLELEKRVLEKIFKRQKSLFNQYVIAAVEFEKDEAKYMRAMAEIKLFKKQSISTWKESNETFEEETRELNLRKEQLENELLRYSLQSPSNGELQNVIPLTKRQYVQAGLKIAEITPNAKLLATCWVLPKDIGLLRGGMKGSFRIDAFNFNEWGTIIGEIKNISADAYVINNQPYFRVDCELERDFLSLKNGLTGKLKKGMTLQASFMVTERTLLQLLYDKVDDWLNPHRQ